MPLKDGISRVRRSSFAAVASLTTAKQEGGAAMKKLMVVCTVVLTGMCLAQAMNDALKDKDVSGEAQFNPMTIEGKQRIEREAEKIVITRLRSEENCVVVLCDEDGFPDTRFRNGGIKFTPWNVCDGKDYIEIGFFGRSFRRYSPDGRLKAIGDFRALCAEDRKVLQEKYLKELGITEDEAKKMAGQRVTRTRLLNLNNLRSANKQREAEREKFFPPLMSFAEAVEKAKNGDGAALYALALHYAKGKEISKDTEKARHYLKKAAETNYPAAILMETISKAQEIKGVSRSDIDPETGRSDGFSDISFIGWRLRNEKDPIKDVESVETVRSGYKKAAALGLSIATDELAHFEKRIAEIKNAADLKVKNEALARELE